MRKDASHAFRRGEAEQRIATALREPSDRLSLRQAVVAFTDDEKRCGAPVERVIVDLKHTIARSQPVVRHLRLSSDPLAEQEDAIAAAVRWCIERYFE